MMWIARDPDGRLKVCNHKMVFNEFYKRWENPYEPLGTTYSILRENFPEVTFENSPKLVEIVIKEE